MKVNKSIALLIAVFFLVFAVTSAIGYGVERRTVNETHKQCAFAASERAQYMENCLQKVLINVDTIHDFLVHYEGDLGFFDEECAVLSRKIEKDTGLHVRNFMAAPGGVVSKVYPYEGNAMMIGFDYLDPTQPGNKEAIDAYHSDETVLTNPFELAQGGSGMCARTPTYFEKDGVMEFWGLIGFAVDTDELVESFHPETLDELSLWYELWYTDENGKKVTVRRTSDVIPKETESALVEVDHLSWHLDVAPLNGWSPIERIVRTVVSCLLLSLAAAAIAYSGIRVRVANRALARAAMTDSLTGCSTRNYLHSHILNPETMNWLDPQANYSLSVLDIDRLKYINDTYGHAVGDKVIRTVGGILNRFADAGKGDCIIRFGGDEFVLLWNRLSEEEMRQRLEDILTDVRGSFFPEVPELILSVSIGAAFGKSGVSESYNDLFKRADRLVYDAKAGGKDRYCMD